MKRISVIVGLCLVAVVAFSAVSAAVASAEPMEYLFQLKKAGSTFPGSFTGKGGAAELQTAGAKIKCTSSTVDTGGGVLETAHLGTVTVLFEGCKLETILGNFECTTAGAAKGHIVLEKWVFHLGGIEVGTESRPGILILVPGEKFEFSCEVATVKVTGKGVIGELQTITGGVPQLNTAYSSLNLVFANSGTTGVQKYKKFLISLGGGTLVEGSGLQLEAENSLTKTKESAAQISSTSLEGFKNSAGEATEIELVS